jgi:hypothetical protein
MSARILAHREAFVVSNGPRIRFPPASDYLSYVFLEMRMSDLVSKVGLGSVFLLHFFERPFREWRVLRVEWSGAQPVPSRC